MIYLTAAQMQALERRTIDGGTAGAALMQRAGACVVRAMRMAGRGVPARALILCGPGNNGGDGHVVARLLTESGCDVTVLAYGDPDRAPADAAQARAQSGLRATPLLSADPAAWRRDPPSVVVDALFGAGLCRPLAADLAGWLRSLHRVLPHDCLRVAIDAPSGLCLDSGRVLGGGAIPLPAGLTVTFAAPRPGHVLDAGPDACGSLAVGDIGVPPDCPGAVQDTQPAHDLTRSGAGGHKYAHGHAVVLAGGPGRGGAARLAARAALRVGAGLVSVACPPDALTENAARLDAVMLRTVADAAGWRALLQDTRINALVLGPGLGLDRARALVPAALDARRATVLDADALTAFAGDPDSLFAQLHDGCVLTPHDGEFARLFPDLSARLSDDAPVGPAFSRIDAARAAAARSGATILLKGPATVIARPDGAAVLNAVVYDRATPWLATAGAGDVLAGLIAGQLAQGIAPFQAAGSAAWLHTETARRIGPGLIAEDLPDRLAGVLRDLPAPPAPRWFDVPR